jgi:hypothetical protein
VKGLTKEDKSYLEEYKNVEYISFNNTGITSLDNFPDIPELKRVIITNYKYFF